MKDLITATTWSQQARYGVFPEHITLEKHKQSLIALEQKFAAKVAAKDKWALKNRRRAVRMFAKKVVAFHRLPISCSPRR